MFPEPVLYCPQCSTLVAEVFTTVSTAIASAYHQHFYLILQVPDSELILQFIMLKTIVVFNEDGWKALLYLIRENVTDYLADAAVLFYYEFNSLVG